MSAYIIAEIDITDPAAYEDYRRQVPDVIARYGGKYIVRGGRVEPLEGGWSPKRIAVVEFPSMEQALKFYRSPEYAIHLDAVFATLYFRAADAWREGRKDDVPRAWRVIPA